MHKPPPEDSRRDLTNYQGSGLGEELQLGHGKTPERPGGLGDWPRQELPRRNWPHVPGQGDQRRDLFDSDFAT